MLCNGLRLLPLAQCAILREYVTALMVHTPEFPSGLNRFVDLLHKQLLPKLVTYCGSSFCSLTTPVDQECGSHMAGSAGSASLRRLHHLKGSPGASQVASQLAAGGRPQFLPRASSPWLPQRLTCGRGSREPRAGSLATPSTVLPCHTTRSVTV